MITCNGITVTSFLSWGHYRFGIIQLTRHCIRDIGWIALVGKIGWSFRKVTALSAFVGRFGAVAPAAVFLPICLTMVRYLVNSRKSARGNFTLTVTDQKSQKCLE
jgi:hypothetical protein